MRFFTPELYLRFNSTNNKIADRADIEWEDALEAYQRHLDSIRDKMPSQVRMVAELWLHDAEVLGLDQDLQSVLPSHESFWPGVERSHQRLG